MNTKHALTLKGFAALLLGVTVMATSCKKDDSELISNSNISTDSTLAIGTQDSSLASASKSGGPGGLLMGTTSPSSTNGNLIFTSFFDKDQTGFNYWEGGDWNGVEAANANSITRSTEKVRGGTHSAKFILNKTDADRAGSKRAELTDWNGRMLNPKSERWYGLSTFLPSSYITDPCEEMLFQWHAHSGLDKDGVSMSNPPLAMYTKNGRWQWGQKFGGAFDLGAYQTNAWTDWVIHIKFSPDGVNGLIEIWKNGQKVFTRTGKNTYNDVEGNYFKMGIYKYGWKDGYQTTTSTRTLYHDEVRVGNENSSYSSVDPARGTTSTTTTPTTTPTTTTPTNTVVFAVNSGGTSFKAANGITYQADKNFSGGNISSTTASIANTSDDVLYRSERHGRFNYAIPLSNGTYEITFKFAEIYHTSAGKRQFDVLVENKEVISNLDIARVAGIKSKYDVIKTVTVSDGLLNINTRTDIDGAKFSAFHIIKK